jgi:hypothetical protein
VQPIRSISEIPFVERDALELLNLDEYRDEPDLEYYQYGFARVDRLCLLERDAPEPLIVRDALLLALHSADEGEAFERDIELEFFVDEVADDYSVTALLSDFLERRLPELVSDELAIVLVLCNPYNAIVPKPDIVGATPMYFALGDVESWVDVDSGRPFIQLVADSWRRAR